MKLFNRKPKQPKQPKERVLYAITNGRLKGVCVIFVKPSEHPKNGIYSAIAIGNQDYDGGMDALEIPEKDVLEGLKTGILDTIRKVPKELYWLCCREYEERVKRKNKDTIDESTS
jgi:hypothetical protein